RPAWIGPGDLNGFLGLALDNVGVLVILSGALIGVFGFPADLVLGKMVPGTALGVLAGDLVYTWLALRLMRRTGRTDVTAMPFGIPSAFAAVLAGWLVHWATVWATGVPAHAVAAATATFALPLPTLAWVDALPATLPYLAIALPFALVTIVGGIDNTESAIAAGDEYRARDILFTEAAATILTGLCGGVIQNTPYIGHPAYKAMGARAGYTLATGVVIGAGAALGALSVLVSVLPEAAIAPILVFIGLEITAQGFQASPPRH